MSGSAYLSQQPVRHCKSLTVALKAWEVVSPPALVILLFPLLAAGFVILSIMWMHHQFDLASHWLSAHQARRHHLQAQRADLYENYHSLDDEERFAM